MVRLLVSVHAVLDVLTHLQHFPLCLRRLEVGLLRRNRRGIDANLVRLPLGVGGLQKGPARSAGEAAGKAAILDHGPGLFRKQGFPGGRLLLEDKEDTDLLARFNTPVDVLNSRQCGAGPHRLPVVKALLYLAK